MSPGQAADHLAGLLLALPILPGQFFRWHRPAILGDEPLPALFAGKAGMALETLTDSRGACPPLSSFCSRRVSTYT